MAAKWSGQNPEKAFIFFHNGKFLKSYQDHSKDISALIKIADAAMYKAKKAGKSRTVIY